MSLPKLYTTAEIAVAFRVSQRFIYDKVRDGVIRPLRLSSARNAGMRFTEDNIEALVEAMRPPAPAAYIRRRRRRRY
ncbi:hypothetical protein GCM10009745_24520 [Kribbella yunnanensis]|uniref:Helix-turn-helix domain-containing protein n=1 Tax=Kribbella yunnanensis TaxID=190194 RepID=A0ABN2H042_9ACTN